MAGGELGLAAHRRLGGLALAGGLGLAEAGPQLTVGAVAGDRGLDLPRGAVGGSGSKVTATVRTALEWPSSASMNIGETSTRGQRADPVGRVQGAVGAVVVPALLRAQRPGVGLAEPVAVGVGGLQRRQLGAGVRIEGGAQRPRRAGPGSSAPSTVTSAASSRWATRSVCSTSASADGVAAALAHPARVDLDGEQDLVLLGDPGAACRSAPGRTRSSAVPRSGTAGSRSA